MKRRMVQHTPLAQVARRQAQPNTAARLGCYVMLLTCDVPDASGPVILIAIVRPHVMLLTCDVPDAIGPVMLIAIARPPAVAVARIRLAQEEAEDADVAAGGGEMRGVAVRSVDGVAGGARGEEPSEHALVSVIGAHL